MSPGNGSTNGIRTLFLDIGGVILTNGWDREGRRLAIEHFGLEAQEVDERHHLTFDTYEEGKLSLDEYLDRVIFYRDREFSRDEFCGFMMSQSQPLPGTADLLSRLKARHDLKLVAVSNEGRELTEYRIRTFRLDRLIDVFVCSCFVHFRKPDADIYKIALDIAQASPSSTLYIEDRPMFLEVAGSLGIRGIHHTDAASTRTRLAALGLDLP
jgi:putative hydrolase of the HAD superfamily